MIRNFTHFKFNGSINEGKLENENHESSNHDKSGPSESVIKNILNYSKALSALKNNLTGNISLILLN